MNDKNMKKILTAIMAFALLAMPMGFALQENVL